MEEFNDRFYPETINFEHPVLKNKIGVKDYDELMQIELELSIVRLFEVDTKISGEWDYRHLANYHKFIFGDLYDWAGTLRKFGVEKYEDVLAGASVEYEEPLMVVPTVEYHLTTFISELENLDSLNLKEKTHIFCKHLAGVWKAHPFNEGNTRVITNFMVNLAEQKGLDMNSVLFGDNSEYFRKALVVYTYDKTEYLEKIVEDAIQQGNRNLVSTRDLPVLINKLINDEKRTNNNDVIKRKLLSKRFLHENLTWRILDLEKEKGIAQANALIQCVETEKIYMVKNFAGSVPFNIKNKKETTDIILQNKTKTLEM